MSSTEEECDIKKKDFKDLLKEARKDLGLTDEEIIALSSVKLIEKKCKKVNWFWIVTKRTLLLSSFLLVALAVSLYLVKKKTNIGKRLASYVLDDVENADCLVPALEQYLDYFRPPIDCNLCKDVKGLTTVDSITPEEFHKKFAFTMKPLLIKGGQENWNARKIFNLDYFRKIYPIGSEALNRVERDCQFFPYKTNFTNLGDVFEMSKARELGKEKPWYIGWSNCDGLTANELRKHYKKPTFLPEFYEHARTDWIFMGLPGYGAQMHIDAIDIMSWQAQIKGTKRWLLQTPVECYGICKYQMEIIVEPGDIVVLDTNKWYHSTKIIGNETSIVIGSEFF